MNKFSGIFFHWLPLGILAVGLAGVIYAAVQQNYRQTLNDPQIQLAEDGATALATGVEPAEIVPRAELIDAGKSLAPFIAVYDADGAPLEASAMIDNLPPKPPIGVFQTAKKYGEDRITWQPNPETRIALVVRAVPDNSGRFVAAGRNMREGEKRESRSFAMVMLGLIAVLGGSFVFEIIGDFWRRKMMAGKN